MTTTDGSSANEKDSAPAVKGETEPLKPCPFCGSEAHMERPHRGASMIYCSNAMCPTHPCTGWCDDEHLPAITEWNRRASGAAEAHLAPASPPLAPEGYDALVAAAQAILDEYMPVDIDNDRWLPTGHARSPWVDVVPKWVALHRAARQGPPPATSGSHP